jgi:hypothetical protein
LGEPAAIVGVVIAGVLGAFVTVGPYDWGSTLLGALLLLVLIGYGHFPSSGRQMIGTAAASAFALLFLVGRWPDMWFANRVVNRQRLTWMTDWPVKGGTASGVDQNSGLGVHTLMSWMVLFCVSCLVLRLLATSRGRRVRRWLKDRTIWLWPATTVVTDEAESRGPTPTSGPDIA